MAPIGGPESCDCCCEVFELAVVGVAVAGALEDAEYVLDAMDEDEAAAGTFRQYIATATCLGMFTLARLDQSQKNPRG